MTPRASRVAALETMITITAMAVCVGACFETIPALTAKARLSAVFVDVTTETSDVLEQFAMTGEFLPAPRIAEHATPASDASFAFAPHGPGLLASGTVGHDRQPFALSFVPAASDDGEARLRWLCGTRPAPAGWRAASAPRVLSLPPGVGYLDCRPDGTHDVRTAARAAETAR